MKTESATAGGWAPNDWTAPVAQEANPYLVLKNPYPASTPSPKPVAASTGDIPTTPGNVPFGPPEAPPGYGSPNAANGAPYLIGAIGFGVLAFILFRGK